MSFLELNHIIFQEILLNLFSTGTVYGSLENPKITFKNVVNLRAGLNKISLLSIAVGLPVCSTSPKHLS